VFDETSIGYRIECKDVVDSSGCPVFEQALDAGFQGILILESVEGGHRVVFANRQFERLSGYRRDELCQHGWPTLWPDDDGGYSLRAALGRGEAFRGIVACAGKDGMSWRSRISLEPLPCEAGETRFWLCQALSLSDSGLTDFESSTAGDNEGMRSRERFGRLDRVDASSGLLKYERFREFLDRDLAIAQREQQRIAVMMLEIVELDKYRQTFGKNAADSCLRMIGKQVTGTLRRATDLCARFADDTIVAAVFGQDADAAGRLRDRIAENIEGLRIHNPRGQVGRFLSVRSIVTEAIPGQETCEALLQRLQAELAADPLPEQSYA
jgi:diguanylate cyclase (GGDEF)-like protein/PAS domain S-box-containing protein